MKIGNSNSVCCVDAYKKQRTKNAVLGGAMAGSLGGAIAVGLDYFKNKPTSAEFEYMKSVLKGSDKISILRTMVKDSKTFTGKYFLNPSRKVVLNVLKKLGPKALYFGVLSGAVVGATLLGAAIGKGIDFVSNKVAEKSANKANV